MPLFLFLIQIENVEKSRVEVGSDFMTRSRPNCKECIATFLFISQHLCASISILMYLLLANALACRLMLLVVPVLPTFHS